MTKLQAIRWFTNFVSCDNVIITKEKYEGTNFAMGIGDKQPRLKLPKDLNAPYDLGDKLFRKNFVERCPMAKGFSTVTLALLHECGHWHTRSIINMNVYTKMVDKAESHNDYFNIPYERLATEWAICWLSDPFNRMMAKTFEKQYFGY